MAWTNCQSSPLIIVQHSTVPGDKSDSPDTRFKDATFTDVDTDEDGTPLGLFGITFQELKNKDLRSIAKAFGFPSSHRTFS